MKTLNIFTLLVVAFLSHSAFADNVPTSLPDGAVSLGMGGLGLQSFSSVATGLNQCQSLRERAAYHIYGEIVAAKSLDNINQNHFTGHPNIQGDVQYACKEIVIKTLPRIAKKCCISDDTAVDVSGTVHAFCVPRSLAEKQLISFSKKCEVNPIEACFEERVLRRLEAVRPTKVTYDHSSPCRSAVEKD